MLSVHKQLKWKQSNRISIPVKMNYIVIPDNSYRHSLLISLKCYQVIKIFPLIKNKIVFTWLWLWLNQFWIFRYQHGESLNFDLHKCTFFCDKLYWILDINETFWLDLIADSSWMGPADSDFCHSSQKFGSLNDKKQFKISNRQNRSIVFKTFKNYLFHN